MFSSRQEPTVLDLFDVIYAVLIFGLMLFVRKELPLRGQCWTCTVKVGHQLPKGSK